MTDQTEKVELRASSVRFFSPGDEDAFFAWLKALPFVAGIEGRGLTLYITVNSPAVTEDGLRELLALFRRYGVDLAQLVAFDRDEFAQWFRSPSSYWHKDIFG